MNPNSCIRELWLYDVKSQEIMHDDSWNVEFLQHGIKRDKHLSEKQMLSDAILLWWPDEMVKENEKCIKDNRLNWLSHKLWAKQLTNMIEPIEWFDSK